MKSHTLAAALSAVAAVVIPQVAQAHGHGGSMGSGGSMMAASFARSNNFARAIGPQQINMMRGGLDDRAGNTYLIIVDRLAAGEQQTTAGDMTRMMTAIGDAAMTIGATTIAERSLKLARMTDGIMAEAMITIGIARVAVTKNK